MAQRLRLEGCPPERPRHRPSWRRGLLSHTGGHGPVRSLRVISPREDNGGVLVNGRTLVDAQTWYTAIGTQSGLPQYYTYSATNVRLQEASIGYTLPRSWFGNICSVQLSVVGRNLLMICNKAPFDPESVASTGNYYQGIDYFMMPSTRSVGLNARINF